MAPRQSSKKAPESRSQLHPFKPRARTVGRPRKNPPVILCDICRKNPAIWQRPVRLHNGELLVHCDGTLCDQAYMKLVIKTKHPLKQQGTLAATNTKNQGRPPGMTHPTVTHQPRAVTRKGQRKGAA